MFALIVAVGVLGIAGEEDTRGVWLLLARLATLWWFFHFLVIMPVLGRYEAVLRTPRMVRPASVGRETTASLGLRP